MADCPQCRAQIEIPEQNFGTLFTCPLCQAVYFVGWEGIPESPTADLSFQEESRPVSEASPDPGEIVTPEDWNQVQEPMVEAAVHVDASANFQDVVEFGNSPQLEGSLTYTIFIKGVDIADTREKIKEGLTDSRFAWDVETLMAQIQNGALTLPDLSPAKAVVLINRIKYLPIEVSWNQNVLS